MNNKRQVAACRTMVMQYTCIAVVECLNRGRRTSLDGGLQLTQARGHLSIHLPLPRGLLREGVPVGAERLADLAAA